MVKRVDKAPQNDPEPTSWPDEVTASEWSLRERELLSVTLQVVQEQGYDRMTIDEVASRARASKATVYRRWPTKAQLVLAAFNEGVRQVARPPNSGSLREDLLKLAQVIAEQTRVNGGILIGLFPEMRRNAALSSEMEREFVHQRKSLIHQVLRQALERGEIRPGAISDEIWDILPGYLVFRSLVPGREVTEQTITCLVDEVLMPSLTRGAVAGGPKTPSSDIT